jgi:hypothetical protein
VTSKKRWKCETSKELVLENRITICEVGSMLTISFGSVQSILKDNLNITYSMHEWFNLNMSHCCQIFAPPAGSSRRIILTHAKTLRQSLKETGLQYNLQIKQQFRLNNTKSPRTKTARQVHWNFNSMLTVFSAFRQLWIRNSSHKDKLWYDIFVSCNWVVTRWQKYSTHLHRNST